MRTVSLFFGRATRYLLWLAVGGAFVYWAGSLTAATTGFQVGASLAGGIWALSSLVLMSISRTELDKDRYNKVVTERDGWKKRHQDMAYQSDARQQIIETTKSERDYYSEGVTYLETKVESKDKEIAALRKSLKKDKSDLDLDKAGEVKLDSEEIVGDAEFNPEEQIPVLANGYAGADELRIN